VRAGRCVDAFQGRKLSALAESYYPFGIRSNFALRSKSGCPQRNIAIVFLLARYRAGL
jgi:hypothetical protein